MQKEPEKPKAPVDPYEDWPNNIKWGTKIKAKSTATGKLWGATFVRRGIKEDKPFVVKFDSSGMEKAVRIEWVEKP